MIAPYEPRPFAIALPALALATLLGACARATAASPDDPPTDPAYAANHVVMREVRAGRGVACDVWNPGQPRARTPVMYRVADLGARGMPAIAAKDARVARTIARYVHSPALRYTYVDREFVVFDATDGPCTGMAPGYWILSDPSCNAFYMPSEPPHFIIAGPQSGCNPPQMMRRPWLPHDGLPTPRP